MIYYTFPILAKLLRPTSPRPPQPFLYTFSKLLYIHIHSTSKARRLYCRGGINTPNPYTHTPYPPRHMKTLPPFLSTDQAPYSSSSVSGTSGMRSTTLVWPSSLAKAFATWPFTFLMPGLMLACPREIGLG